MCGGYTHRPVLLEECIQGLAIRPDGIYVDGTLGRGGHSEEIAKRLTAGGRLLCIDRDRQALEEGAARLAPWAGQITFLHGNFGDLDALLDQAGVGQVDGMLFDLGVSSPQLDDPERGFSYQTDAPLDMRMDREDALTAWTVVNQWPQGELRRILTQYGEERHAGAIASAIVRAREQAPIATTGQLVEPPPCGKSSTRPSEASRPSASRSTMSWVRSPGCCSRPSRGCAQVGGWR